MSTVSPLGCHWHWSVSDFCSVSRCDQQWDQSRESLAKDGKPAWCNQKGWLPDTSRKTMQEDANARRWTVGWPSWREGCPWIPYIGQHESECDWCQILFRTISPGRRESLRRAVFTSTKPQPVSRVNTDGCFFTGLHLESNKPPTHPSPNKARRRDFRTISLPLTTEWGSRFGCLSLASEGKMIILINWNESHSRRGARNSPDDLSPFST